MTITYMWRSNLITKEAMEKYCKGEKRIKNSVNDDLESFFEDLRLGKKPKEDTVVYFLPKLTEEEMKLVERKDISYLETFQQTFRRLNPDVPEAEMMLSESNSKYVYGMGDRQTFTIENKFSQNISNLCNLQ